jgi:hypothetical protein
MISVLITREFVDVPFKDNITHAFEFVSTIVFCVLSVMIIFISDSFFIPACFLIISNINLGGICAYILTRDVNIQQDTYGYRPVFQFIGLSTCIHIIGFIVQAMELSIILNHNALFHCILMIGLVPFFMGVELYIYNQRTTLILSDDISNSSDEGGSILL